MLRAFFVALFAVSLVIPALAETAPKLPATAKKLTGAEIRAFYDGSSVNWHNYAASGTGTAKYDFEKGTQDVTYNFGGDQGSFTDKIRIKGNRFCYTVQNKETCVSVYTDGDDIYETNSKGIVLSKNQKR